MPGEGVDRRAERVDAEPHRNDWILIGSRNEVEHWLF